jgi:hypothetical protein
MTREEGSCGWPDSTCAVLDEPANNCVREEGSEAMDAPERIRRRGGVGAMANVESQR